MEFDPGDGVPEATRCSLPPPLPRCAPLPSQGSRLRSCGPAVRQVFSHIGPNSSKVSREGLCFTAQAVEFSFLTLMYYGVLSYSKNNMFPDTTPRKY